MGFSRVAMLSFGLCVGPAACSAFSSSAEPESPPDLDSGTVDGGVPEATVEASSGTDATDSGSSGKFCTAPASAAMLGETRVLCADFDDGRGLDTWNTTGSVTVDGNLSESSPSSASVGNGGSIGVRFPSGVSGASYRLIASVYLDSAVVSTGYFTLAQLKLGTVPLGLQWSGANSTWFQFVDNGTGSRPISLSLTPNAWHQFVLAFDAGVFSIKVDGAAPYTLKPTNAVTPSSGPEFTLGDSLPGTMAPVVHIDNVAFFSK